MIDAVTGWYFMHLSVKVVVVIGEKVLLGRNPRGDWELLGGWPDKEDASLEETAIREVREEAAITITPQRLINAFILRDPKVENPVAIVAYGATIDSPVPEIAASAEHSRLALVSPEEALGLDNLLPAYKQLIADYLQLDS